MHAPKEKKIYDEKILHIFLTTASSSNLHTKITKKQNKKKIILHL